MALATCADCGSEDIDLMETLPDSRKHVVCLDCGHDWLRGKPTSQPTPTSSYDAARRRFPSTSAVTEDRIDRVAILRNQFVQVRPEPDPAVTAYWQRYQHIFSIEGLPNAAAQDLKDFANTSTGANPGNMSVFNREWNELGAGEASQRVRDAVHYLLYGPESLPIEDRLTQLIRGDGGLGMKGFRESLLTKVLCIMEPDRFLPILMYTGVAGKKEIAEAVFGVPLPRPEAISMTPGRLVFWSNDLLREMVGDGFPNLQHASQFLWWAKDQVATAG